MSAQVAQAELVVGDYRGPDIATSVFRYGDMADGALAPNASFDTNVGADVLLSAASMTFEPVENVIYVADFWSHAIRVYAVAATGNAVPLRTIDPPALGQPRQVAVSVARGELLIANTCCIATYLSNASGGGAALQRYLPSGNDVGSRTRLNNPGGIVLRVISDEMAVPDLTGSVPGATTGVVLFFPRALTGNSSPYRTLEGAKTLLGLAATGVAYDDMNDELIVVSQETAAFPSAFRVSTFAGSASGNTAPLRSIAGSSTLLDDVHAIHYDAAAETLYVSAGGEGGTASRVLAFPRGADGNVAPDRVILPVASSFVQPAGITTICDCLFRNGFN